MTLEQETKESPAKGKPAVIQRADLPGVDLEATLEVSSSEVTVRYSITNGTDRTVYCMFPPTPQNRPFVEVSQDGTVEISERLFTPPGTVFAPVTLIASKLAVGEMVTRELRVQRPLMRNVPPGYGRSGSPPSAEAANAARYCLGVVDLDELSEELAREFDFVEGGVRLYHGFSPLDPIESQRLFCTEPVPLS